MELRRVVPVVLAVLVVLSGCVGVSSDGTDPDAFGATSAQDANGSADALDSGTSGSGTPGSDDVLSPEISQRNGTLSVHFIHVGQGGSALVVGPTGETLLYDTGNWNDDGEHVLDYLRARNVTRIDYLVTSHADADHVGGHAEIIDYYETEADGVGAVYDPGIAAATRTYESYLDAVETHDVTLYRAQSGDAIPMAGASVRVLAPPEGYFDGRDRNENSLVLRAEYENASVLLTGDVEATAERHLARTYDGLLNATILSAGHHGSNSSTGAELLSATAPRAVVIQSAYDSPYGHPHREVLERLAARDVPTYWTGVHGDVVFRTDGERVAVRTQRNAPTDPLELRSAPGVSPIADDPLERRTTFDAAGGPAPSAETVVADGGTTGGEGSSSPLEVARVHADAQGDETGNLNDEYVVFRNAGERTLDLAGWTVADEAGHSYTFSDGTTLAPGETLTLHTGSGTDTKTNRYWGNGRPIWNNDGDTVFVRTDEGRIVLEVEYDG